MTQVWKNDEAIAVTRVQADPCTIVQIKNDEKDGYTAVQLGYGVRKEKNINKPQKGHMKDLGSFQKLREFRCETGELKRGDKIDVNTFEIGDKIQVTATSKGRGFQGVVKRHGFGGSKKTHGNKDQLRMPGSIGATGPAHVFKGTKMGGRMGGDRVTVKNLEVIEIDTENNILSIKGAIPGPRNGLVLVSGDGELKIVEIVKEEVKEEAPKEVEEKIEEKESVENSTDKKEEKIEEKKAEEKKEENKKEEKK